MTSSFLQALDMGEVAADLHGEDEVGRRFFDPPRDHLNAREPVEGGVDLDRPEPVGVVREPLRCWQAGRVENAVPPVLVVPAGAADFGRARKRSQARAVGAVGP